MALDIHYKLSRTGVIAISDTLYLLRSKSVDGRIEGQGMVVIDKAGIRILGQQPSVAILGPTIVIGGSRECMEALKDKQHSEPDEIRLLEPGEFVWHGSEKKSLEQKLTRFKDKAQYLLIRWLSIMAGPVYH